MSNWRSLEIDLNNLQNRYELFEEIDSTNDYLMNKKVNHGQIVRAEFQTQGKGRKGRKWESDYGKALLFSLALTKNLEELPYYLYTFLVSVSIAEAMQEHLEQESISVKWPNDVLLDGKKVCGTLVETKFGSAGLKKVVIGIGLNVNQDTEFFKAESLKKGTSLKVETGISYNRENIFAEVLESIDNYITQARKHPELIFDRWRAYCSSLGQNITVETEHESIKGVLKGISEDGTLLLQSGKEKRRVHTGDVILNRGGN